MTKARQDGGFPIEECTRVDQGINRVFTLLGKRWTGVIIAALMSGPGYFSELRRSIPGISERMLSDRLSELSDIGLVAREVESGPPLRVRYRLTECGQALEASLRELGRWADRCLPEDGQCPERFRG